MKMTVQLFLEQAGQHAHHRVADLAVQLGAGDQRGHGVHHQHVDGAGADQRLGDVQSLLAGIRLGDQQAVDVHTQGPGIGRFQGVLHVDVSGLAAVALGGGDHVQGQGGLTGGLRPVDLHDPAPGDAPDAKSQVQGERTGGERLHIHGNIIAKAHDGALAVVLFDLGNSGLQRLFLVGSVGGGSHGDFFLFGHFSVLLYCCYTKSRQKR